MLEEMENFYSPEFGYKNDVLHAGNFNLQNFAQGIKTPFYLYNRQSILNFWQIIHSTLGKIENSIICYAVKANHNVEIIREFGNLGCGADCVSGGEIFRAIKAGISPEKIVFAGAAKTDEDLEYAIQNQILQINVESFSEISRINSIAKKLGKAQKIAIRICPGILASTHKNISTGGEDSKFGIEISQISNEKLVEISKLSHTKLAGFSIHIGSQLFNLAELSGAVAVISNLTQVAISLGIAIETIDVGGGFGVKYRANDEIFNFSAYLEIILKSLENLPKNIKTIFEPGRFLIANSGVLIAKLLCIKENGGKKFAILDAGMNDLARPAIYGAHHDILPIQKSKSMQIYDICGAICESTDFFARAREISQLQEGDFVAIMSSGAYGSAMSSEYNSRGIIDEYLLNLANVRQIRKRRAWEDLA